MCLRGRLLEEFYDESGVVVDSIELAPGGPVVGLNIPIGQWHTVRVLESGTVIMEVKDWSILTNRSGGYPDAIEGQGLMRGHRPIVFIGHNH